MNDYDDEGYGDGEESFQMSYATYHIIDFILISPETLAPVGWCLMP